MQFSSQQQVIASLGWADHAIVARLLGCRPATLRRFVQCASAAPPPNALAKGLLALPEEARAFLGKQAWPQLRRPVDDAAAWRWRSCLCMLSAGQPREAVLFWLRQVDGKAPAGRISNTARVR
jgi:hypothetical protein